MSAPRSLPSTSDPERRDTQDEGSNVNEITPDNKRTPLPVFPLLIIFLIQFAEPVTATVIYPFINKLVRDTGAVGDDERKVGYFAGIIVRHLHSIPLTARRDLTKN